MNRNPAERRWWTKEEDEILRVEVEHQLNQGALKNWSIIAEKLHRRTNKDCRKRWGKVSEPVKKGAWSHGEDERLRQAVNQHGYGWIQVAQSVGSRHADQCAKRWRQSLDPSIDHSRWTADEDNRLMKAVSQFGHNWRTICNREFQGRSTTDIKNRHVLISRKHHQSPTLDQTPSSLNHTQSRQEDAQGHASDSSFGSDIDINSDSDAEQLSNPEQLDDIPSKYSTNYTTERSAPSNYHHPQQPPAYTADTLTTTVYSSDNIFAAYIPPQETRGFATSLFDQPTTTTDNTNNNSKFFPHPQTYLNTPTSPDDYPWNPNTSPSQLSQPEIHPTPFTPAPTLDFPDLSFTHCTNNNAPEQRCAQTTGQESICSSSSASSSSRIKLILEDMQPDTVSMILSTLCNSGRNFKVHLENEQQS